MADEFPWFFSDMGYRLGGPCIGDTDDLVRRSALLDNSDVKRDSDHYLSWKTMQTLDVSFKNNDVIQRRMKRIEELSAVHEL